jgi:hypothetical protein
MEAAHPTRAKTRQRDKNEGRLANETLTGYPDCDFADRSKHRSVTGPDCVQQAKNPISYHSHPCRVLCGASIAMS